MPQGIDFRTRVQFPPGPLTAGCIPIRVMFGRKVWRSLGNVEDSMFPGLFLLYRKDRLRCSVEFKNARTEAGMITRKALD